MILPTPFRIRRLHRAAARALIRGRSARAAKLVVLAERLTEQLDQERARALRKVLGRIDEMRAERAS